MSVSHVSPSVHFHRHTRTKTQTKSRHQRRIDTVFAILGIALLGVFVLGFVGIIRTAAPNALGPSPYSADGGGWVTLPHMAILWLWVTLMNVAAMIGLGIAFAFQHQK